jgi:hypothetical protein
MHYTGLVYTQIKLHKTNLMENVDPLCVVMNAVCLGVCSDVFSIYSAILTAIDFIVLIEYCKM